MGEHRLYKLVLFFLLAICFKANAQYDNADTYSTWRGNMSIGAGAPKLVPPTSTALVIGKDSTNKAVILPRVLDTTLITSPTKGMTVYVIPLKDVYLYDGTKWKVLGSTNVAPVTTCQGLIFGGAVTLNSGLIMNVTNAQYCINNNTYNSPSTILTLNAADATFPRKDIIVVNTSGVAIVKTGTPAANPIQPQPNPSTEIFLAAIDIPANATTPANIVRVIIYNENTGTPEWATTSALTSGGVNFAGTTTPYIGTKDIDASTNIQGNLIFTKSDTINIQSQDVIQAFIRLKGVVTNTPTFQVAFTLGGAFVTDFVTLDNTVGFIYNTVGSYQNVSIPIAKFNIANPLANGIVFKISGANTGFYLDYIQLQSGITPPIPNYDNSFLHKHIIDTSDASKLFLANDTVFFKKTLPSSGNKLSFPSTILALVTNHPDTTTGLQYSVGMNIYAQDIASTNPIGLTSLYIQDGRTNRIPIAALGDGSVIMGLGVPGSPATTISQGVIGRQGPLTLTANTNTQPQVTIANNAGALTGSGALLFLSNGGATGALGSRGLIVGGDRGTGLLNTYPAGTVSISNSATPSSYINSYRALLDLQSAGRGLLIPRQTTSQRDGMFKKIVTVTLTNGGSGYSPNGPIASVPTTGLPVAIGVTTNTSTGVVTGLSLLYGGTNYPTGGSITFAGGSGTGAAGTYTVGTDTIPCGLIIYNIDSNKIQQYNCGTTAWENVGGGGSGGGGSVGTLQQVTDNGNTTTNDITANDITANGTLFSNSAIVNGDINSGGNIEGSTLTSGSGGIKITNSANTFFTTLVAPNATAARTVTFQNGSGTVAYLSDITGGGSTNSNIGSGFRFAVPNTNNIKTLFAGLDLLADSTTNTNAITLKLDTAKVFDSVRAMIARGGGSSGDTLAFNTDQTRITTTGHTQNLRIIGQVPNGVFFADGGDSTQKTDPMLTYNEGSKTFDVGFTGVPAGIIHLDEGAFEYNFGNTGTRNGLRLHIDDNAHTVDLGDDRDFGNSTLIHLDDDAQTVNINAASGIAHNGSVSYPYTKQINTDYTATLADHTISVDNGSGSVTITLPKASDTPLGTIFIIKRYNDASTGTVTVNVTGNGDIQDMSTMSFGTTTTLQATGSYGQVTSFVNNGTQWEIAN